MIFWGNLFNWIPLSSCKHSSPTYTFYTIYAYYFWNSSWFVNSFFCQFLFFCVMLHIKKFIKKVLYQRSYSIITYFRQFPCLWTNFNQIFVFQRKFIRDSKLDIEVYINWLAEPQSPIFLFMDQFQPKFCLSTGN